MQTFFDFIETLLNLIDSSSNRINQIWKDHKLAALILFILPYLFIMITSKYIKINFFISFSPWIVLGFGYILVFLEYVISIIYIIIRWLYSNYTQLTHTAKSLIIIAFSFLILVTISLAITVELFKDFKLLDSINDPVFNGEFLPNLLQLSFSLIVLFILFLIYHFIFVLVNENEWVYKIVDITLIFLVAVAIVFILGINSSIIEYVNLRWKQNIDLSKLSDLEIEQISFYYTSNYNLISYWITSLILCFQSTFKIANSYRLSKKSKKACN